MIDWHYDIENHLYQALRDVDSNDYELVENTIGQVMLHSEVTAHLTREEKEALKSKYITKILGFDVIDALIKNQKVSEIMVNDFNDIYYEESGKLYQADISFDTPEDVMTLCKRIAYMSGKSINRLEPMVNGYIGKSARVNMIIPPISHSPTLTIRKFQSTRFLLDDLRGYGAFNQKIQDLLTMIIKKRKNCFICGGTGSGKTTLLNAMLQEIDGHQRIIVMEDVPEIKCPSKSHALYLLTRDTNQNGVGEVNMNMLIQNALRMRPDRIVVGEVRGKEVVEMIHAMNTGHEGSISTGHANSNMDMYNRLRLLMTTYSDLPDATIDFLLASSIQYFIYVRRCHDGRRILENILSITYREGKVIFEDVVRFDYENMDYVFT